MGATLRDLLFGSSGVWEYLDRNPTSGREKGLGNWATWRVGGLSKWLISRLTGTLKGVLIGVMRLISLQKKYLLSPPTLQVGAKIVLAGRSPTIFKATFWLPNHIHSKPYTLNPKPKPKSSKYGKAMAENPRLRGVGGLHHYSYTVST